MKICAYCTTQNRDEAIFCSRCKRALQATPTRKEISARHVLNLLLAVFVLFGLGYYFLSSRPIFAPTPAQTPTAAPPPTHPQEPITPSTCVGERMVRIRRGPGTNYETVGGLLSGACFTILGRNEESSWVYIVSDDHQTGWVAANLLNAAGDLRRVSVRDHAVSTNFVRPTLTTAEIAHGAQVYLTQIAATNIPQSSLSRNTLPCFEAVDRIGDHISCKLEKAHCDYLPNIDGSPTSCSDRPYPDHIFTLLVPGQDWSEYDGQCLIVSGFLEVARGALQIQVLNRSQVSACS